MNLLWSAALFLCKLALEMTLNIFVTQLEFDLSVNWLSRGRVLNRTFTDPNLSVYKIEQLSTSEIAMIPS
jgi:hypothetical protein